jgi:hypothetical protein
LLYAPYLEGHFYDINNEIFESDLLFIDFMYQIIDSINIMRKKGYDQNDLGMNNIMFKKNNESHSYQWYIIDYGNMCNKKFPVSQLDKDISSRPLCCMDLVSFVDKYSCYFLMKYITKHKIKIIPTHKFIENLQKEQEYDTIVSKVPESAKNKKFTNKFIELITKICYPKLFLKCIDAEVELYENYNVVNQYADLFIYCLQHYDDESYDSILIRIKQINKMSGGE